MSHVTHVTVSRFHSVTLSLCHGGLTPVPDTCTNMLTFCLLCAINAHFKHLCKIFYNNQHKMHQIQLTCTTLYTNKAICMGKLAKIPYFYCVQTTHPLSGFVKLGFSLGLGFSKCIYPKSYSQVDYMTL